MTKHNCSGTKGAIVTSLLFLALMFSASLPGQAFAATKLTKKNTFTVSSNGKRYTCFKARNGRSSIVLKQSGSLVLGSTAVSNLKKQLVANGQFKTSAGKKKLAVLKKRVSSGDSICTNASSGSTSLTKLSRPMTREDVQYLLDKAALGLSSREEPLVTVGLNQGVDALVEQLTAIHTEPAGLIDRVLDRRDGRLGTSTNQTPVGQRVALLDLWIHTNNPYQEKFALTLLSIWTSAGDVISDETFRSAFWDYYEKLRASAYGSANLPDLALALTRDPLMLIYLNNDLNVKGNPNENYARELMELFSLGPTDLEGNPNYTETRTDGSGDIAVAAKMLTGWRTTLNYATNKIDATFDSTRHQNGPHVMFAGKSYQFSGNNDEDLVRGIFAHHPSAKLYYANELLKIYVTPKPPRGLIEAFGDVIATKNFNLKEAMKVLLSSEAFYDPAYKDTVPMNSVEFAAKSARLLELYNAVQVEYREWEMQKMGLLFNMSPSVFWYPMDTWSSSSIALEKSNLLAELLSDTPSQSSAGWSPAKILPTGVVTNSALIDAVAAKAGTTRLNSVQRQALQSYLSTELQWNGAYTPFTYDNTNPSHQRSKGLGLFYILLSSPEYNLL